MEHLGMSVMNRGDVYWVNFDPSIGSEITKKRPAIIVSNHLSNLYMPRVQVIPLTSNISRVYTCETLVLIHGKRGKAMADQITTVDKSRLGGFIIALSQKEMEKISVIIKLQLELN